MAPGVGVVVLAGGASRRFGADKLVADLGGRPVLGRCLDAVAAALPGAPVVVVGPPSRARDGADVVAEDPPGSGPAAGVLAGARHLATTAAPAVVAVVPGDAPWAGSALPALLAALGTEPGAGPSPDRGGGPDAAVAVSPDGRLQHLLLAVRAEHLARHRPQDVAGAPARALVVGLRVELVEVDERAALDVDDADALERARERLGRGG